MKTKKQAPAVPPVTDIRRNERGQIWSAVRHKWLFETPEEQVRQGFLSVLATEYGYSTEQIGEEESLTGRGSAQARADQAPRRFVWKETSKMSAGSRARWACGQVAWRPVHMSTGRS